MSAVQELCCLYGVNPKQLSKIENALLEASLFTYICDGLNEIYRCNNKDFFRLCKFTKEMENKMLEENFMRCVINDIISTEEYTLDGIAHYSGTSEDVIEEVATGINVSPSLSLERKIIELHRAIRPDIYRVILNKVTQSLSTEINV